MFLTDDDSRDEATGHVSQCTDLFGRLEETRADLETQLGLRIFLEAYRAIEVVFYEPNVKYC